MTNFKGIIPAIAVPFRKDHSIDEAGANCDLAARRKGIVGLMTNGHTGGVLLTEGARGSHAHHRQGH